jgi:hypothetical protein
MPPKSFYDFGLEQTSDVDGWAIVTSKHGEEPHIAAFFRRKDLAESALLDGDDFYFDAVVELAVLTSDMGIIVANDVELTTHELLRERIAAARAAGMAEEV